MTPKKPLTDFATIRPKTLAALAAIQRAEIVERENHKQRMMRDITGVRTPRVEPQGPNMRRDRGARRKRRMKLRKLRGWH